MKEEFNMDKIFREKLEGFPEEPPAFVWDNIQANLSGQQRRKRMAWYSWSAVAALLLLAFIAGWYFNESADKQVPQVAETEKVNPVEKNNIEEQIASFPENDDLNTEPESVKNGRFLAETTKRESEPQMSVENLSGSEMNKENRMLAFADLSLMKSIGPNEVKLVGKEQISTPTERSKYKPAKEIFSWVNLTARLLRWHLKVSEKGSPVKLA